MQPGNLFLSNKLMLNMSPFLTALVALFLFMGMTEKESFDFYKQEHCSAQITCVPSMTCDVMPNWDVYTYWKQTWDEIDSLNQLILHEEVNGLITIFAQEFQVNEGWTEIDEAVLGNTTAENTIIRYIQSLPDTGKNLGTATTGAHVQYRINFSGGIYYLWMKGNNPSGSSDSISYGTDGSRIDSLNFYKKIWSNSIQGSSVRAVINVLPGVHHLNIWSREDGTRFSEIRLTKDGAYKP